MDVIGFETVRVGESFLLDRDFQVTASVTVGSPRESIFHKGKRELADFGSVDTSGCCNK